MDILGECDGRDAANWLKHGFGFKLVAEFDWSNAAFIPDQRFDYGEDRVVAYGRIDGRGYAVVYVRRGERVRIISLRPAHQKEMRYYGV